MGAVERYIRITALAAFARETARVSARELGIPDEGGWAALAEELGLHELYKKLKKCKPYDWLEASALESGCSKSEFAMLRRSRPHDYAEQAKATLHVEDGQTSGDPIEEGYIRRMDEWWEGEVMPL